MKDCCSVCGGYSLTKDWWYSGMCQLCLEPSFAPMALATGIADALANHNIQRAAGLAKTLSAWLTFSAGQPVDVETTELPESNFAGGLRTSIESIG